MIPRPDYRPSAYDDDWEDAPSGGPAAQWSCGVALPLLLIGYGVSCLITQSGVLPHGNIPMEPQGARAMALGIACASLAPLTHTGNSPTVSCFDGTLQDIESCCTLAEPR